VSVVEWRKSEKVKQTASGVWCGTLIVYCNGSRARLIERGGYATGERTAGEGHPAEADVSTSC
jgi:hypothetical protein